MTKKLLIMASLVAVLFGGLALLKGSSFGSELLWSASNAGAWLFPLVAVSALLDSINPCAFSVLILTLVFLFSLGVPRVRMLHVGGAYIFGIFLAYLLIGLGLLQALHLFGVPHFMGRVGALLMLLFGVMLIVEEFFPHLHLLPGIPRAAHEKMGALMHRATLPAAFLLGALVGLCEFPCTGGPYLMVLGLLHDSASYLRGFLYLLFYNLLFIAPLAVLLLVAANRDALSVAEKIRRGEMKRARLAVGLVMAALGLIILLF